MPQDMPQDMLEVWREEHRVKFQHVLRTPVKSGIDKDSVTFFGPKYENEECIYFPESVLCQHYKDLNSAQIFVLLVKERIQQDSDQDFSVIDMTYGSYFLVILGHIYSHVQIDPDEDPNIYHKSCIFEKF